MPGCERYPAGLPYMLPAGHRNREESDLKACGGETAHHEDNSSEYLIF
jgi:hypothetical protein